MAQRASEVIVRLLGESGANFQLDPPHRLSRGARWSWQELAHALLFTSSRVEQHDLRGAARYLGRLFGPELDFDLDGLEPLACDALAEIFNLWGIVLRREGKLDEALAMFDAVLRCTDDAGLHHYALYNRGHTHARIALDLLTHRRSRDEIGIEARLERALADLGRATTLDPTDAAAWAWTGLVNLARASVTAFPVHRRLVDYRRAVAAYRAGLEHERDADERATMESNLALAVQGVDRLESLGWLIKRFGRSPYSDSIEWPSATRYHRSRPPTEEPFPLVPGSAAALVSLAPGCGVWVHGRRIHGRQGAVLCVLSDASPPPPPGCSTPVAILDLSNGTIPPSTCSTIATNLGLGDAEVVRIHEVGTTAAMATLNQCDWTMSARRIPGSDHALQLLWDDANEHVLVGVELGAHEILATPLGYGHIVGSISSASLSSQQRDDTLTRLVGADTRFWTMSRCVDQPLLVYARIVGVPVTAIAPA